MVKGDGWVGWGAGGGGGGEEGKTRKLICLGLFPRSAKKLIYLSRCVPSVMCI